MGYKFMITSRTHKPAMLQLPSISSGRLLYPQIWLSSFVLEYASRKVQENQVGQKLNGTHQLLIYTDDVHLLEIT
jgi:hypothetical protein